MRTRKIHSQFIWRFSLFALAFLTACEKRPETPPSPPPPPSDNIISSLPWDITNAGTYRLGKDLTAPPNGFGIFIKTNHVVLDLNGKTLRGGPGHGTGVVIAKSVTHATVQNGTIREWGNSAVNGLYARHCLLTNLTVISNHTGISLGSTNTLVDCVALDNRGVGLSGQDHTTIINCRAENNRDDGIVIGYDSVVENSISISNRVNGFYATQQAKLTSCQARHNDRAGILGGAATTIIKCELVGNKYEGIESASGSLIQENLVLSNQNNGITVFGHATVVSNKVVGNVRDGIRAAFSCRIIENFCEGNGRGGRDTGGIHTILKMNRIERNVVIIDDTIGIKSTSSPNQVVQNIVKHTRASGGIAYDCKKANLPGPVLLREKTEGDVATANYELPFQPAAK